jgi:hypothetical protein
MSVRKITINVLKSYKMPDKLASATPEEWVKILTNAEEFIEADRRYDRMCQAASAKAEAEQACSDLIVNIEKNPQLLGCSAQ